jgi:hypothetical protein
MDRRDPPSGLDRLMAGMRRRNLSRRRFLQVAGASSAAAFLAACARQIGRGTQAGGEPEPELTGPIEDELVIYNWAAYLNTRSSNALAEEFGVKGRDTAV